ncbi:SDR family NAD(P)-dependent oxidoreductase [Gracilibacillus salitolerans]|uniref:SDR family NAD(P)-dependent oxidoreductase n=1 Tax=Gracilibacillus salitolerans TaxID=2663022 RepID=A0A5Q2TQR8_9BACI|nr:SDR family NAD(P)-dependent oxidoreductase [Gracilibacillus salitolerans]QGH35228.1 SDR family NAD(P)-dependent oxidoreductase [Gracilibacillus salitolerans]
MFFKDKTILVIGGTGTIGTSVIAELLQEQPKKIKIFSRDEYKQHVVKEQFHHNNLLEFVIGDVRDEDRVEEVMTNVDYVLQLAAMKRVDTCEKNPIEAVQTNIMGTYHVMKAAIEKKVKKVVFTSSDKAIAPTNAYGATKLIGERLISASGESDNVFASVRFGNVMGSRGSVIPLFQEQIRTEQKITVTDPKMTRFMMTVAQATKLTINALKEAKGGEVFVLKMPVIRLGDLAEILIRKSDQQVTTEIIGLKAGEKMYEELMTYEESLHAWEFTDMFVIPIDEDVTYPNAIKAKTGTYSSVDEKVLSKKELYQLLTRANLI